MYSENLQDFSELKILDTPPSYVEGIAVFKKTAEKLIGGQKIEAVAGGIAGPFDEKKPLRLECRKRKKWNPHF